MGFSVRVTITKYEFIPIIKAMFWGIFLGKSECYASLGIGQGLVFQMSRIITEGFQELDWAILKLPDGGERLVQVKSQE